MPPATSPYRAQAGAAPPPAVPRLATLGQRLTSHAVDIFFILSPWVVPPALTVSTITGVHPEPIYVGLSSLLVLYITAFTEALAVASGSRTLGMRYAGLALAYSRGERAETPSPKVFLIDVAIFICSLVVTLALAITLYLALPSRLTEDVLVGAPLFAFMPNLTGLLSRRRMTLADRAAEVCVVVGEPPTRTGSRAMAAALATDLLLFALVATPTVVTVVITDSLLRTRAFGAAVGLAVLLIFAVFECASLWAWRQSVGMRVMGVRHRLSPTGVRDLNLAE